MDRKNNINDFVVTYLTCWADAMKGLGDSETRKKLYRSGIYEGDGECKGWTDFHLKKILYPLAEKLGYKGAPCSDCGNDCKVGRGREEKCGYNRNWSRENYKADLVLYNWETPYRWGVDYVVEHGNISLKVEENGGKLSVARGGWLGAFVKLLPLNCAKARVIIGYDAFGEGDWEKKKRCLLDVLGNKTVKETLSEKPILLILGPSCDFIDGEKNKANLFFRIKLITKVQNGWEVGDLDELLAGNGEFLRMRREMCDLFAEIRN